MNNIMNRYIVKTYTTTININSISSLSDTTGTTIEKLTLSDKRDVIEKNRVQFCKKVLFHTYRYVKVNMCKLGMDYIRNQVLRISKTIN